MTIKDILALRMRLNELGALPFGRQLHCSVVEPRIEELSAFSGCFFGIEIVIESCTKDYVEYHPSICSYCGRKATIERCAGCGAIDIKKVYL